VAARPRPLVTGLVSGGSWDYVRAWVTSLRAAGYAGEVALLTAGCEQDLHTHCARWDVTTIEVDPADLVTRHLSDPYNGRHVVIARLIEERYRGHLVLACDTRDIVFQADPFEFFESRDGDGGPRKLHVVSEQVCFDQDESEAGRWGAVKVGQLFSARERAEMRGVESYNIGVLCGPAPLVAGIQRLVHLMCFNATVQVTDQAALNVMMQIEPCRSSIERLGLADGWAVHFASVRWGEVPADIAPTLQDGLVKTPDGRVFSIVHQYDRARGLRELVQERLAGWDPGG
jgi:hypothetical protein